jgi:hypothetical protein
MARRKDNLFFDWGDGLNRKNHNDIEFAKLSAQTVTILNSLFLLADAKMMGKMDSD